MKKYIFIILFSFLGFTLSAQQEKLSRKEKKEQQRNKDFQDIKTLVDSGEFEFNATWALPREGTRINLVTNRGFLNYEAEHLRFYFPFFGETHISTSTNGRISYDYEGQWENYQVSYDDDKRKITITGEATHNESEHLQFILKVSYSGYSTLSIVSSFRARIRYEGFLEALKVENKLVNK